MTACAREGCQALRCVALERGEQGLHQEEDQVGPFKGGPTVLRG